MTWCEVKGHNVARSISGNLSDYQTLKFKFQISG